MDVGDRVALVPLQGGGYASVQLADNLEVDDRVVLLSGRDGQKIAVKLGIPEIGDRVLMVPTYGGGYAAVMPSEELVCNTGSTSYSYHITHSAPSQYEYFTGKTFWSSRIGYFWINGEDITEFLDKFCQVYIGYMGRYYDYRKCKYDYNYYAGKRDIISYEAYNERLAPGQTFYVTRQISFYLPPDQYSSYIYDPYRVTFYMYTSATAPYPIDSYGAPMWNWIRDLQNVIGMPVYYQKYIG